MGSCFALLAATPARGADDLVPLRKVDATLKEEIRYAQYNNPTKQIIYPEKVCVLRESLAQSLARVQQIARLQGLGLKALDCYRPLSLHEKIRTMIEEKATEPEGCDARCAGGSVDVTLVDSSGNDIVMPGKFGAPARLWKTSGDAVSGRAKKNHRRLVDLMKREGFFQVAGSWSRFETKASKGFAKEDRPLGEFK